jgi:hypothetical protein
MQSMYGLRRVCLPVVDFVYSASTIHLLNLPSETAYQYLGQAMQALQTMSTNHTFAGRCVNAIRSLALEWHIIMPGDDLSRTACQPSERISSFPRFHTVLASTPHQDHSHIATDSAESRERHSNIQKVQNRPIALGASSSQPQDLKFDSTSWTESCFFVHDMFVQIPSDGPEPVLGMSSTDV